MDPNEYVKKKEGHKLTKPPRTEIHVVSCYFQIIHRLVLLVLSVNHLVWLRRTGFVLNVVTAILQLATTVTFVERRSRLLVVV